MTDEEFMDMAKQAHVGSKTWVDIYSDQITVGEVRAFLKAFAKLVAEKEREECAKIADSYANGLERNYSEIIADKIRARIDK